MSASPAGLHSPRAAAGPAAPSNHPNLVAAVLRGRVHAPEDLERWTQQTPALAALTVGAALLPGLLASLFPGLWHVCWSGLGVPAILLGTALLATPLIATLHAALGQPVGGRDALFAVLAGTARASLWGLTAVPVILACGLVGIQSSLLHMLVAGPVGFAAAMGLFGLLRALPRTARTVPSVALSGLAVAASATAAAVAIGGCGDPVGTLWPGLLPPAVSAAGLWLSGAVLTAHGLRRRALPGSTATLFTWPLMLPALMGPSPSTAIEPAPGPLARSIAATFAALHDTLRQAGPDVAPALPEAQALRRELEAADARLVLADQLLAEPTLSGAGDRGSAALAEAVALLEARRDRAEAEVHAVLDSLHQLRVQVGLQALAGEAAPVRQRLADLRQRLRALEEVDQT